MTTASPPFPAVETAETADRRRTSARGGFAAARHALDRPLTSYYLLIGASAMLLTVGLVMVLSASSVYAYRLPAHDSYAIVKRQLLWVALGVPYEQAFVEEFAPRLYNVGLIKTAGGLFNFLSGSKPRAPRWMIWLMPPPDPIAW